VGATKVKLSTFTYQKKSSSPNAGSYVFGVGVPNGEAKTTGYYSATNTAMAKPCTQREFRPADRRPARGVGYRRAAVVDQGSGGAAQ